jgi:hypothetical protein
LIKSILNSRQTTREKIKKLVFYFSLKNGTKRIWNKKQNALLATFSENNHPLPFTVKMAHRQLWSPFQSNFNFSTLKLCRLLSDVAEPEIVPEEIFRIDIEPTLNCFPVSNFQAHKSFYNRWYKVGLFPQDLLHIINGEIFDKDLNPIKPKEATDLCNTFTYPVIMKPNMNSYGGKGVQLINNPNMLSELILQERNVVVQNRIHQHPELAKFNNKSINTVRIYLYKSVRDNKFHILGILLRMGNGGFLDNVSAGGFATFVNEEGTLPGYALGPDLNKFYKHPYSNVLFEETLPDFNELKKISLKTASQLFLLRIVGLDLCYDINRQWRVIEINTTGHTIRSIQYFGKPFFGRFTNEVIEFCKKNHWATIKSQEIN